MGSRSKFQACILFKKCISKNAFRKNITACTAVCQYSQFGQLFDWHSLIYKAKYIDWDRHHKLFVPCEKQISLISKKHLRQNQLNPDIIYISTKVSRATLMQFHINTAHEVPTIHLKANQKSSIEHRLSLVMAPLTCRIVLLLPQESYFNYVDKMR